MILAMVRHGQTEANKRYVVQGRTNNPLNETGREQAHQVALMLKEKNFIFDRIVSSPLSRSLETAYIIKNELNHLYPILVDPYFVERDFNQLEGMPVPEAMPLVHTKGYTHEGYEDDEMMIKRITKAVFKLEQSYPDKKLLLVAHSHVIKALNVYIDPVTYHFTDILNNAEVRYFEVKNQKIKIIQP